MTQSKKKTDTDSYKELPKVHWSEVSSGTNYHPGAMSVQPTVEFFDESGITRVVYDHKLREKTPIHYDADYAMQYIHRIVVTGMGFASKDGILEDEGVFSNFLQALYDYSVSMAERKKSEKLQADAEKLAADYPTKTVEEWKAFLAGDEQEKTPIVETTEVGGEIKTTEVVGAAMPTPRKRGRPPKAQD